MPAKQGLRDPLPNSTRRLSQRAAGIIFRILWPARRWQLIGAGALTLVLSLFAPLKATIETAVLNLSWLGKTEDPGHGSVSVGELLQKQVTLTINDDAESTDCISLIVNECVKRFSSKANHELPLYKVLGLYSFLLLITFVVMLAYRRTIAALSHVVFRTLRGQATERLFYDFSLLGPSSASPHAEAASSLQFGATNFKWTTNYFLSSLGYALFLVLMITVIALKDWSLALACFILVAVLLLVVFRQGVSQEHGRREHEQSRDTLLAHTDDILSNRELIQAWEQSPRCLGRLQARAGDYGKLELKLDRLEGFWESLFQTIVDLGKMLLLTILVLLAVAGFYRLQNATPAAGKSSNETLFLIVLYSRLIVPTAGLSRNLQSILRSATSVRRFLGIVLSPAPKPSPVDSVSLKSLKAAAASSPMAISFEDVHLSFPQEAGPPIPVLRNCQFEIPSKGLTLVLSPSGGGKSSIARLIMGFLRPDRGRIRLFGQDTSGLLSVKMLDLISYVPQSHHVLAESVRDNLTWTSDVSDDRMLEVIAALGLASDADAPDFLKRDASTLSVGQKQRLAVARLLLDEKSELVLMDEPMAGVDVFALRDFLPELRRSILSRTRTFVIFSHRLEFAALADYVILVNGGRVEEEGCPLDLLENQASRFNSIYSAAEQALLLRTVALVRRNGSSGNVEPDRRP
jgi:ABC-type multidrug transport system fused ATPase/permease subunit